MTTDAVILMAGAGSRLGAIAKPLVPVAGRPLISSTIYALERVGVRTIQQVMGSEGDRRTTQPWRPPPPTSALPGGGRRVVGRGRSWP